MLAYQAGIAKFDGADTQVFGVSEDFTPSQKEFADKLKLTFPLLSDFSKRKVAQDYGVLIADLGIANRATFVIDKRARSSTSRKARPQWTPAEPRLPAVVFIIRTNTPFLLRVCRKRSAER